MSTHNGLTAAENEVMAHLVLAWNKFLTLERQHPDELPDFKTGIHLCQNQLMNRIVRRDYPDGYPTYKEGEL